jgi:peptidoglycan hydrolase FlgJ
MKVSGEGTNLDPKLLGNLRENTATKADVKPGAKAQAPEGVDAKKWQEAQAAATEFETLFMDLIVKGMRQTAKPEDASNASDIYTGMLDSEHAKSMTSAQSFGVREMILDWMKTSDPSLQGGQKQKSTDPKSESNLLSPLNEIANLKETSRGLAAQAAAAAAYRAQR